MQDASDIGYATATYTCTGSLISSTDTYQGQLFEVPQIQPGNTSTLQTIKKMGHPLPNQSHTIEDHSQPTFDQHQTDAHSHAYDGYSNDCLAQDIPIPQAAADGWPPQLNENYDDFLQHLNMESLLPHLLENSLLTQSEIQELECFKEMPRRQNLHFLQNVLPQKGRGAIDVFIKCLKAEKKHLGHRYLVEKLCDRRRSLY